MASSSKLGLIGSLIILVLVTLGCGKNDGHAPSLTASCGGDVVGGYCWYQGLAGESCDTVCSAHGGYNEATRTFAGSAGTNANCESVLDAIGIGSTTVSDVAGPSADGYGCGYSTNVYARVRVLNPATNSSAADAMEIRACACNE